MAISESPKKMLWGLVVALGVVFAVVRVFSGGGVIGGEKAAAKLHEECGAALADMTRQALDGGQRVLVLEHNGDGMDPIQQEWIRTQMESFYRSLSSRGEITKQLVGGEEFERLAEAEDPGLQKGLRYKGFFPFAEKAPEADVIVSFVGEPMLNARGANQWAHLPPVVCFSSSGEDVPALMEAGVVVGAIVPRDDAVPIKQAKKMSTFELMYEIVTPENIGEWGGAEEG